MACEPACAGGSAIMAGKAGTLESIAEQIAQALQPLETLLTSDNILPFLAQLGLQFPPALLTTNFNNTMNTGASAAGALDATITQLTTDIANNNILGIVQDGEKLVQEISGIIAAIEQIGAQINAQAATLGMIPHEVEAFASNLVEALLSYLLITYVEGIASGVVGLANLLGIISYVSNPGSDAVHPPFISKKLQLSNLGKLLSSPSGLFQTLYQWNTPAFDGTTLLPVL